MSIEVKNLLKEYGEQKAVDGISFKIEKGEIAGFLGPNGAGKSTTMKIIAGYLQQTAGKAFVCGLDVAEQPLEIKKKIGYLPEANALYYDMFVQEYLLFIASVHQLNGKARQKMKEVIELTGLTRESKKKIGQLSKGYKQRVGLAAALIHDPEVLILDEPTSGLDPNQIIEIREVIKKQGKDKTVLFSSHILQEVEAVCDRVIIIHKGRLVADDKLSDLQQKKQDRQAVLVQFKEMIGKELLEKLEGVLRTEKQDAFYKLHTNDPVLLRKRLLELALEKHLNIVSLQDENQRLEDIFRGLTGGS